MRLLLTLMGCFINLKLKTEQIKDSGNCRCPLFVGAKVKC